MIYNASHCREWYTERGAREAQVYAALRPRGLKGVRRPGKRGWLRFNLYNYAVREGRYIVPTHYLLEFESLGGGDKRSSRLPEASSQQNLFDPLHLTSLASSILSDASQMIEYTRNSLTCRISPLFLERQNSFIKVFNFYSYVYQISLYFSYNCKLY